MKRAGFLILLLSISAVAQTSADLILVNANIRTLDKWGTRAEAIAAADGKIIAVGTNASVKALRRPRTNVIDAGGRLVIPGFNDAHVHFTAIGNRFSHLDLRDVNSIDDILLRLKNYTDVVRKGRWIIGGLGLHEANFRDGATRWTIDPVSPNHPILFYFANPKIALANSEALRLAGISRNSSDPPGGQIFKRANGEPTGILTGEAVTRVRSRIPSDHGQNWAEIAETASNYAASLGVTSVQDVHSDDLRDVLRELNRGLLLKTRVYECLGIADWRKLASAGEKAATGDAMVRTGCVKDIAPGNSDDLSDFRRNLAEVDNVGLQMMVHAIGESANSNVLDAFEKVVEQSGPRDRRFRVEHAHNLRPSDIRRFAAAGIIASMQPHLFFTAGAAEGDDFRAIFDAGAKVAFGSDASITDFNPLLGIHATVNSGRRSISVEEAVRAYTAGSAYAEFQEDVKGTLEIGKLADFVILSDDIFTRKRAEISKVKVLTTVVGGKVVYSALGRIF